MNKSESTSSNALSLAKGELLQLVDRFFMEAGAASHVEVLNALQYHWLTTARVDLSTDADQDQLMSVRLLIDFLSNLYEINQQISYLENCNPETN